MTGDGTTARIPGIRSLQTFWKALVLAAGLCLAALFFLQPERAAANLLLVSFALITTGLAGIFFISLHYLAGASWYVAIRRIPEAMVTALWPGAAGLALLFLLRPELYAWTAEQLHGFKAVWLNWPFFLTRSVIYLALWILFGTLIVRRSRAQDFDGKLEHTFANIRLSTGFVVVFAVTFWPAAFDWLMSLEPEWYSTIFGIYQFSGLFLSGLATITLLTLWLNRMGLLQSVVSEEHLHDLGKLLFAFSTFWMYIWFSQYMLIWYANIPEETVHYVIRLEGMWGTLFLLNMALNWAIPFLVLLPRRTKRSHATLVQVCLVLLLGRWLDLYLMIFPAADPAFQVPGLWEVVIAAGAVSLFLLSFWNSLGKAALIPIRDPRLCESLPAEVDRL